MWRDPERLRDCAFCLDRTRPEIFARKCFESAMRRRIAFNCGANPESGARTRTHSEGPASIGQQGKPLNASLARRRLGEGGNVSTNHVGLAESAVKIKARIRLTHFREFW